MRFRRFGAAVSVVVAFGLLAAASASATATTEAKKWFTGSGGATELTAPASLLLSAGSHGTIGSQFVIRFSVASMAIEVTASGVECVSCSIENKEITGKPGKVAYGSGQLKFSGLTVMPAGTCTVSSSFTTQPLKFHFDYMEGPKHLVHITPVSGETIGSFTACTVPVKLSGSFFGAFKSATGNCLAEQGVEFSPAINTVAGGELKFGPEPAELTGTANLKLSSGTPFCVK
jgi:hypothetical protein